MTGMARVRHGILAAALVLPFGASARDCVQAAAKYHRVSETVLLRAIAWHESKHDAWAVGKNSNGTLDIGRMQVNTIHLCRSWPSTALPPNTCWTRVCRISWAWLYAKKVKRHGNTWAAVGALPLGDAALRDAYARKIHDLVYPPARR